VVDTPETYSQAGNACLVGDVDCLDGQIGVGALEGSWVAAGNDDVGAGSARGIHHRAGDAVAAANDENGAILQG